MQGMSEKEAQDFQEKVAAATIANQAVLRCLILGMPATIDNVILCVSDFVDPADPRFESLIEQVQQAIEITVGVPQHKCRSDTQLD